MRRGVTLVWKVGWGYQFRMRTKLPSPLKSSGMDHTVVTLQTHHTRLYVVAFTRWRHQCRDKWLPISCRSGAGQGMFAGQRPTFYHWATTLTFRDTCIRCNRGITSPRHDQVLRVKWHVRSLAGTSWVVQCRVLFCRLWRHCGSGWALSIDYTQCLAHWARLSVAGLAEVGLTGPFHSRLLRLPPNNTFNNNNYNNNNIVVTNVINVTYNFDKNGLSKVIYAEKVIYFFK